MAPAVGAWSALGAAAPVPALVSGPSPTTSTSLSMEDRYALSEAIGREDPSYAMASTGDGYALSNATNQYQAVVDAGGLRVESGADAWSLSVLGVGYGGQVTALGSAVATADGNRVDYDHGGVSQWYVNGPLGLQQGFTLAERPAGGDGLLTVDLAMGGSLTATADAGGRSVTLARADGSAAMSYGGLIAYDATGRETPAFLSVRSTADGDVLSIQVDDADAVYPLVIDPYVQQQPRLTGQGSQQFMFFGYSVAISGDGTRAAIGSRSENVGSQTGAGVVYVFDRVGSSWVRRARLTATDGLAGDQLGFFVTISLDGTTVAAGAPAAAVGGSSERGAVYVFAKPGGTWQQVDKLIAEGGAGGDHLGTTVSISGNGDAIVAGAADATVAGHAKQGAAYVFTRWGGYAWTQTANLIANDGADGDNFGTAVAISADGGSLVVSAPAAMINGKLMQGAVYVFDKVGLSDWSRTAKRTAPDGAAQDLLGSSVAISSDGSVILAGAPNAVVGGKVGRGMAYVFARVDSTWVLGVKLIANDGAVGDSFGSAVALSADGTTALVGAPNKNIGTSAKQGAAYVFANSGGSWPQTDRLVATGGFVNDNFSYAVAANLDGSAVMIGSPGTSVGGTAFQGTAYGFANPRSPAVSISPSSRTVTVGTPTTFTTATSTPNASVRWQVSTSFGEWTDIPGETKTWYTVTPTLADSGTRYRAVVTADGQSATTASAQITVVKAGVVLNVTSNVNPRRLGDPLNITINATAAIPGVGVPDGGTITVVINSKPYSGTLRNGLAVFAINPLPLGTFVVTATYNGAGDPIFGSATATMTQVVVRGTTTMTGEVPTFATAGDPVTLRTVLTFAGTGVTPIGGVVINDGGQPIRFEQIRLEGGQWVASYTTTALAPGDHYIRFIYLGEAMAEPARTDEIFHLFVSAGGAAAAAADMGGRETPGSPPSAAPSPGAGAPSPGGFIQPEAGVPPSSQTATAGIATTFTAAPTDPANASAQWQVSAAGGGAWTNISGATNWWYTLTPSLADSGKRYRAVFSGGGTPETTTPAQLTVVKAGTILRISSDINPRRLGDPLNLIVDATSAVLGAGVPDGGTITVKIGPKTYSGTMHYDGKAIFAVEPLGLGTYTATATYDGAGDPVFSSATAAMTQVVVRGSTTMTGEVPTFAMFGQPVTLKTALSFAGTGVTPSGGVMINDGGQPIRFEQIRLEDGKWVASFTTGSLAPGDHYIRFIYLGESMAEPARTEQIYHLVIGGGGVMVANAAPAPAPFTPLVGSGLGSGGWLPQPDMAGAAAALTIAEATKQKPASAFERSSDGAAGARAIVLPNALTARRFQQRLVGAGASGTV